MAAGVSVGDLNLSSYFDISRSMENKKALAALAALSHETRLSVFRLLVAIGPSGLSAGAIADELDVLPNTLSTHLGNLSRAGLVVPTRVGRTILYAADYEGMRELMAFLLRDWCGGKPEICAPLFTVAAHGAARGDPAPLD